MCGISSIASVKGPIPDTVIGRMVARLAHRGPDGSGIRRLEGCDLGHARLSVIDLEGGAQPMADASGRYWIAFNGEIYNYREVREELLALGHRFDTRSDTEVVLAAYSAWGRECFDRFRGMFAFALWDTREKRLFAARDLFGEKPLYYAAGDGGLFLVASEIKALVASGMVSPRLDRGAVDAYLALGYVPPDRTIYENVRVLPPGHVLTWRGGEVAVSRYWSPRFETSPISLEDAAERLKELLRQAVGRQMVADVPVGAFLSGGLDSSTIVALMGEHAASPVQTFSAGFGKWIDERPYARLVAQRYGTDHHEVDFGTPPVAALLERMQEVYDEPFADSSNIPTYLLSEFARRHVKVVLSGDGGDELFGGYWWYEPVAASLGRPASYFRWAALRLASRAVGDRNRSLRLRSVAAGLSARAEDPWARAVLLQTQFKLPERRRLWGKGFDRVTPFAPGEYFRPSDGTHGLDRAFCFDLTSYLPGDILVKVDRAAMAHGLETRTPLLDRDLVEFALSLPAALKVNGNGTKVLFRHACAEYWPPELRGRGKLGFGAPYLAWLGFPDVQALSKRVFAAGSPLRRLLPGISPGDYVESSFRKWMLLTLGLWLERNGAAA